MKRSIAVVAAGRGLTVLWVLAQVMCITAIGKDSAEVYRVVNENRGKLVTEMITNRGLEKTSKQFDMSPLRVDDINPIADDEDATTDEPQKIHQRQRPRAPAYMVEDYTKTGSGSGTKRQTSQAADDWPEMRNGEMMATGADENLTMYDINDV